MTIPRAIVATLVVSGIVYSLVAVAAVGTLGAPALANLAGGSATPLESVALALPAQGLGPLVAVGAVVAMVGVMLNLILGLSRVALAMGRRGDLPKALAQLDSNGSPRAAVIAVGLLIASLTLIGDVKATWSFSAFTVLVYYSITNLAALRLPPEGRLFPRTFSWMGLVGCLSLAAFVPWETWLLGLLLLGVLMALTHGRSGARGR